MGLIPARCAICTSAFHSGNISCLPCGHTFHYTCVIQWIQQSKTCPHCRCNVFEKNIIKQVYFDLIESDNQQKTSAEDFALKCEELSIELEKEKGSTYEMKQRLLEMQKKCDSTNDLLEREKKKVERKLPQLESRNRELEMMGQDYKFVRDELNKMEKRLKASQFYELLMKGSLVDAETAIDKYVNDKGDIASGSFITLMKRQLEECRNVSASLKRTVQDYEKELKLKNKKVIDLKNLLQALKAEAEELRSSTNRNTPYNSKLKRVFDITPPEKRVSLGFDQSIVIPDDVIDSAFKSKPVMGRVRHLNEEDQDDSFNADYQSVMDKALPFPSLDDTLNSSADFTLPKNVLDRISARSPQKKTNPFGIVPKGAQRSLEILKNKQPSAMAPRPIKKPVKRKFEPTNPSGTSISFFRNLSNSKLQPDIINL